MCSAYSGVCKNDDEEKHDCKHWMASIDAIDAMNELERRSIPSHRRGCGF